MRTLFVLLILLVSITLSTAAEPAAYDITFFKVANAPQEDVYVYNYLVHYEGTQNQMSTFTIDESTLAIQEGETKSYATLEIQITDSSANAQITTNTNEQVTGQVAVAHITTTSPKEQQAIIVRQGDEIENTIEVINFGYTQTGEAAIEIEKGNLRKLIAEGEEVFFAQRKISVDNIVTGASMSSEQNLISAKIRVDEDYDLADYPWIFAYADQPTYIVSGAQRQSYHSFAATDIALSLPQTGQEYHNVLDTDTFNENNVNLILIGGPCENEITQDLLDSTDCTQDLDPGQAKITLLKTGDRTVMLVRGYAEQELRFAARQLREGIELEGEEAILETTLSQQPIAAQETEEQPGQEVEQPLQERAPEAQVVALGTLQPQEQKATAAPEPVEELFVARKLPWYQRLWRWIVRTFGG